MLSRSPTAPTTTPSPCGPGASAQVIEYFGATANDTAIARGRDASAQINDDSGNGGNTVTARGSHADAYASGDSGLQETASGRQSVAQANGVTNSTVNATGTGAQAKAEADISNSTLSATGRVAYVDVYTDVSGSPDSGLKVTANGNHTSASAAGDSNVTVTATGTDSSAAAYDSSNGSAISTDTGLVCGPVLCHGGTQILDTTNSSATATGPGSGAEVGGTQSQPVDSSSAVDTNGTNTDVMTSDTHLVNGMPAPADTPLLP